MATGADDTIAPRTTAYIGSVNLVAQVADKLLSFAQIVVIAAVLGSSAGGDIFFLASIVPLTIGFVIGEPVGRAYMTLLVRTPAGAEARRLAASALTLTLAVLFAVTAVYDVVVVVLVKILTPAGSGDVWPWLAFSAVAPAMGVAGLLGGLLIWLHHYAWAAARVPLASAAGLVLLSVAVRSSDHLVWIGLALSGGYVVAAAVLWLRVAAALGARWPLAATRAGVVEAAAARGMLVGPAIGGAIGGQVIVTIERILAGTLGTGFVASISYARGIATAPTVLAQAVGASGYPRLVRAEAARDVAYLRESLTRGLRLSLYLGSACATFLILFGSDAVVAIFQRGHFAELATSETGRCLVAFGWSTLTGSLIVYLVSVIYGLGRFRAILWLELAVFGTYLVAAPVLRATDGLVGLAYAFAVAQAAGVVAAAAVCMRTVHLRPGMLVRTVLLPIAPLVIVLVAVLVGYRLLVDHVVIPIDLRGLTRAGGAGACLVIAGSAILLASPLPEAAQLRSALRRRSPSAARRRV